VNSQWLFLEPVLQHDSGVYGAVSRIRKLQGNINSQILGFSYPIGRRTYDHLTYVL